MRTVVLLAAVVAALSMGSQVVQARDQGSGRHFSAQKSVQLHRAHRGFKHRRHVFAKPRHFKHFGQQRSVFRFGDHGGRIFRFDQMPRFKPGHFRAQVLKLYRPWRFAPQRLRGFTVDEQVWVWRLRKGHR